MSDSRDRSSAVEVRDEYDSRGCRYMAFVDPERAEAWIRVPYSRGSQPDFSDPETWAYLRRRQRRSGH